MANTDLVTNPTSISRPGLFICLLGLLAIFFSIILRNEPVLMQSDILRLFHIPASTLSDLAIRYQYSLIATLLFAGLIVDLFGPRTILTLALVAAIAGNSVFGKAAGIPAMIDGRILIGYAHPFILISVLKLGTQWLPKRHFAFFCGLLFAILLMTPVITKNVLTAMVNDIGMRAAANLINCLGVLLIGNVLATYYLQSPFITSTQFNLKQALPLITNGKIWLICMISLLGWIGNTFLLNYGATYLIGVHHFTRDIASDTVSMAFACFALGAITMGMFADLLGKKQLLITLGYLLAASALATVLYMPGLTYTTLALFFFATSFFTGTAVISYAKAYDFCSDTTAGSVFALIAFITTLGNVLFTLILGNLLQPTLPYLATTGAKTWQQLLGIIPAALAIGGISAIMLHKKTPKLPA